MGQLDDGRARGLGGLEYAHLLDALEDEVVILDSDGVIVAVNQAWRQFSTRNGGDTGQFYVGHNYLSICRAADGRSSTSSRIVPDGLERTLRTGAPFRTEYPCDSPTEKRWFELTATRFAHDGRTFLLIQHRNITARQAEREEIEQAFINSNAMIALVATTSDAILSYDLDGRIITWNKAAERLYGYSEDEAVGQSLEILYPPDWPKRVTEYRDEILAGRLESFEATRIAKDGAEHEVWVSCAPIRSLSGDVVAISNIHRDVTEVRKAERARDLMAHEVIHRSKNMLSIVTAIQRQTARAETTLDGFRQSFEARIRALAHSTDLLVNSVWTTVELSKLIERHLEPFARPGDPRILADGPVIELQPQAVQAVGLALHELGTNSAKYGVLSRNDGRIALDWEILPGEDGPELRFSWAETGVDVEPSADRKGFGNTVLTGLAPSMLNAATRYDLGDGRVLWSIAIPGPHFSATA